MEDEFANAYMVHHGSFCSPGASSLVGLLFEVRLLFPTGHHPLDMHTPEWPNSHFDQLFRRRESVSWTTVADCVWVD